MRVRTGTARLVVRTAVACATGVAGVGLWAAPAVAFECPSRATQCQDWPVAPEQGWRQGVVCPDYGSHTVKEYVHNATSNPLTLAVRAIDCWDWSNTGNPSQITGRVLGPGETAKYRLEQSRGSTYRYDLGVFVPADGGLRQGGMVNVWSENITGEAVPGTSGYCRRQLLGEDPQRSETTESFLPTSKNVTTIYSDGTHLYGVRCGIAKPGRLR